MFSNIFVGFIFGSVEIMPMSISITFFLFTGNMTHANTKDEVKSLSNDQRMKVYEDKEKAFYEFLEECECGKDETGADKLEDKPLTGLQCLLALTEILDRAAKLRVSNYDLEQRIEILQRFKLIAEVIYRPQAYKF